MHVVVHYHEIGLKGRNRFRFIQCLANNLERCMADACKAKVTKMSGRLVMSLPDSVPWDLVRERLGGVFGVANFSLAYWHPLDLDSLKPRLIEKLRAEKFSTFRVRTKRAFKSFPLTSLDINRDLGHVIRHELQRTVNLDHADLTVYVEVVAGNILFYFKKETGLGGLPVGVTGRVVALISGGIDSPVACFRLMRRGCTVTMVHFHSYPFHSKASQEKVEDLAELLTQYQFRTELIMAPFGEIQRRIKLSAPAPYRIVLYRRMMLRIAAKLAELCGAKALVTGESLAQVSSQTLENLTTTDSATEMPVLRPLIGMDKNEICDQARALDSFEISILPDEDCCQLFMPRRPILACTQEEIEEVELRLDVPALVRLGVEGIKRTTLTFPGPLQDAGAKPLSGNRSPIKQPGKQPETPPDSPRGTMEAPSPSRRPSPNPAPHHEPTPSPTPSFGG